MGNVDVRLGRPEWIGADASGQGLCTALQTAPGQSVIVAFEDRLRPGAIELMRSLKKQGLEILLLSGDREKAVAQVAAQLGISCHASEKLPADKVSYVQDLTQNGNCVLMVGDGLNDTGALAAAHVSISPAQALDAARAASDIVLLGQDLAPVADAIATARLATKRINENFTIATVYNVIAVPAGRRRDGNTFDRSLGDVRIFAYSVAECIADQRAHMNVLAYLIPISLILGGLGLLGFIYTLRTRQYEDPEGDSRRILNSEWDDRPRPD